jgi:hypothetical protein
MYRLTQTPPINFCEHCKNIVHDGQGFGTRGMYCRLECWFQATADEYKKAYEALMAVEHGGDGVDVLAQNSDELIAEYGDLFADNPNDGESFDAFMMRTVYEPAWARGEYPDLGEA